MMYISLGEIIERNRELTFPFLNVLITIADTFITYVRFIIISWLVTQITPLPLPLLASTPEQRVFLIHFEAENISKIEIIQLFR